MPRTDYFAPGVYIEEIDRGSRPIEGVATAIGGFVGFTEAVRDGAELFKPMMVTNWSQYLKYFAAQGSDGYTDFNAYLPFAVYGYFLNGGGRCYVTSIGTQLPSNTPTKAAEPPLLQVAARGGARPSLTFTLKPEQLGAGAISVNITEGSPRALPDGQNPDPAANSDEYFSVIIGRGGTELERYDHVTMNREVPATLGSYVVTALQASAVVTVQDLSQGRTALARRPSNGAYELIPVAVSRPDNFYREVEGVRDDRTGVRGIFEIDEITMLACPDLMRAFEARLIDLEQVHGVMEMMVSLCEGGDSPNPPNRMVLLDAPPVKGTNLVSPDQVKPQDVSQWLDSFNRRSQFAALYYPWIKVPNPRNGGKGILVPPCGHLMGVWGRTDETRGVYKAPANESPRGVIGLAYETNFREQELLNPKGINCLRSFPNRGIKIWGARTLVEPDKTEWRYISVRRLISYIEKSVELGTQWVVFEPNDQDLWMRVKRTVANFLERLWREGALFGATPEQAFYVKCDEELNPPETMILGRLYIEVGICPVRPAEFVIFRFSQWSGQTDS